MRPQLLLVFTILLAFSVQCKTEKNNKLLVPKQANEFIHIYKPDGDLFFGPTTENLNENEYYEEWVPNDHTFVKGDDGLWHIFGITHPLVMTNPLKDGIHEGEYASFHAVSLVKSFKETLVEDHYIDQAKVLPPKERPGEVLANHAPYIIKKDGVFQMVYGHSPIRLAVSKDLYNWTPKGNLFQNHKNNKNLEELFGDARDPNVLEHQGTYYITYCSTKSVRMRESKDFIHWSEEKIILNLEAFDPESPSLIFHNGTFYLFVCSWDGNWDQKEIVGAYQHKTYVMQSDNIYDFGTDHEQTVAQLNGHAPEIFQDEDGQWYISSVEWPNRGVSVDKLDWVTK